nr:hypothetical protein Iba_chr05eCG12500 [Ipomoea batatas]
MFRAQQFTHNLFVVDSLVLSVCHQRHLGRAGEPQPHAFSFSPFSDLRARCNDALRPSVRPSRIGRSAHRFQQKPTRQEVYLDDNLLERDYRVFSWRCEQR